MRIAIDLHIHSALSPCAQDDMTPNNIVNMSLIKGLDAIAITDHNSCDNVGAAMKVAGSEIVVLPGMELQSREEVHILCYFASLSDLKTFESFVRPYFQPSLFDPLMFGRQLIMDENDEITGEREELLISSIDLSIDEIVPEVRRLGGVAVPAHIDRPSFSIISQLGFIPPELGFKTFEISALGLTSFPRDEKAFYISSSDAHYLENILERESFLSVEECSASAIIQSLLCS